MSTHATKRTSSPCLATRVATSVATAIVLFGASARAVDLSAPLDCVMPNTRETICGRVDAITPDRRDIAIRLPSGSIRHVSWYDIVTAWGPSFPMRRTERDAAVPFPGTVVVQLESVGASQRVDFTWADPVVANDALRDASAGRLRRAGCTTPCTLRVAPGAVAARATGADVPSRPIAISIPTSDVRIRLQSPSRVRERVAEVFAVVGGAMMIAGLIFPLAIVGTGGTPTPAQEPFFWGSLGVSAAGTLPSITSIAMEQSPGVASIERLCRAASVPTRAPWFGANAQGASASPSPSAAAPTLVPCR